MALLHDKIVKLVSLPRKRIDSDDTLDTSADDTCQAMRTQHRDPVGEGATLVNRVGLFFAISPCNGTN